LASRRQTFRSCACGLTGSCRPLYSGGFATPAFTVGGPKAPVAELVDALDSKSSSARSAGSIPARGTSRAFAQDYRRSRVAVSSCSSPRPDQSSGASFDSKQKLLALGPYPVTSLADARIKRDDAKKLVAEAIDPSVNRRKEPRNGRMARAAAVCSRWTRGQIVVMSGKRRPTRDELPIRARFIEKPFHHC
jgi:Arm domain-containing DNA-binding protein